MKKFLHLLLAFALAFALVLGGCANTSTSSGSTTTAATQDSPRTVAYKTLATLSKTYTATMKSIADLYNQGLVDDTVKAKAIQYGNAFKQAHDAAITAVESGGSFDTAGVTAALTSLLTFVQPYLTKAVK